MQKRLIVTHHAPDLDAIGAVWLLKRFDAQHYADAHVAFVDPGQTIEPTEAERLGFQMHEVTHVDTGLGEFDHHQPERGPQHICATSLVYDHVAHIHPEEKNNQALRALVEFITDIDHFDEVAWPEANSPRYEFMLHELIEGFENLTLHDDDAQLHFGIQCLDCAYAALRNHFEAAEEVKTGQVLKLKTGQVLALESRNDGVIKFAQKAGYMLVIRRDPKTGQVRIKARPDSNFDLKKLATAITAIDKQGTWYAHTSGKMLLNGSRKHRHQRPTQLTLDQITELVKEHYG